MTKFEVGDKVATKGDNWIGEIEALRLEAIPVWPYSRKYAYIRDEHGSERRIATMDLEKVNGKV